MLNGTGNPAEVRKTRGEWHHTGRTDTTHAAATVEKPTADRQLRPTPPKLLRKLHQKKTVYSTARCCCCTGRARRRRRRPRAAYSAELVGAATSGSATCPLTSASEIHVPWNPSAGRRETTAS